MTGTKPQNTTSINYYPVIYNPITQYLSVQEYLQYAEQATDEVGQHYVFSTYDLGVCMKAYPLVWNFPGKFKRHIILIGTFHLIMAYLKMIGKKTEGLGFEDVLLESGLISLGSLQGVLTGKNFSRSIHCHKVLFEALSRLIMKKFTDEQTEFSMTDMNVLFNSLEKNITEFLENDQISKFITMFMSFRESVKAGHSFGFHTCNMWDWYWGSICL